MSDYNSKSVELHRKLKGKLSVIGKSEVNTSEDLSTVYSPGVAEPCRLINENEEEAYALTIKGHTVAVVSDGSAVLGLGNIGAKAAIPVMEGKAMLFKKFGGLDAFPICLDTQDPQEIIETVRRIAPVFGGVNLEDISAPRCFEVEEALQDLGIPVFHDDQHGTAIVVLAGLVNACRVTGKNMEQLNVVINGAGAAGVAIAKLLRCISMDPSACHTVNNLIVCDSKGVIHSGRENLNTTKQMLLTITNTDDRTGTLQDVLAGADVFIGVSKGNLLSKEDIALMADKPIVFALANPTPEIMPELAKEAGVAVIATGRSDYPNQVNNVLAFPGIFKGALAARAERITSEMKLAAAYAIAGCVEEPTAEKIIPDALDPTVADKVAEAMKNPVVVEPWSTK